MIAVVTSVETITGIVERGLDADFVVLDADGRDVFATTEVGSVEPDQVLQVDFVRLPDEVRIVRECAQSAAAD